MFTLVESRQEIAGAQRRLEDRIRRDFRSTDVRDIGYPGGTMRRARIASDGHRWFWSADNRGRDVANPRRLNWFGVLRDAASLHITVEVNVAYEGRNENVAGYFARDTDTGLLYLVHSGRLGGGTPGVGKLAFLAWCSLHANQHSVEVVDSKGNFRQGLVVMPIDGASAMRSGRRYIDVVASFKQAVREKKIDTPELRRAQRELQDYYAEARGRRVGKRSPKFEYVSRHGEVIDALRAWRGKRELPASARFVKNQLIDMGIEVNGELVEVYEAKTRVGRAAIYVAIGQLLVHGAAVNCSRVLVLPADEPLGDDIAKALRRLRIGVLRFNLDERCASIL